jgi:hypothetical protein
MAGCGMYALLGFPLDDIWHRIFGQDVTLWGPTHLMMIGGAGFSTLSALMLNHEGLKAMGTTLPTRRLRRSSSSTSASAASSSACRCSRSNSISAYRNSARCSSRC